MILLLRQFVWVPLAAAWSLLRDARRPLAPAVAGGRHALLVNGLHSVEFVLQDLRVARWLRANDTRATVAYFTDVWAPADIRDVAHQVWETERPGGLRGAVDLFARFIGSIVALPLFVLAARRYCRRHDIGFVRLSHRSLAGDVRAAHRSAREVQDFLASDEAMANVDAAFIRRVRGEPFDPDRADHVQIRSHLVAAAERATVLSRELVVRVPDADLALTAMPYYVHWGIPFWFLRCCTSMQVKLLVKRPGFRVGILDESPFTDEQRWLWERFLAEVPPDSYREEVRAEIRSKVDPGFEVPPLHDVRPTVALYPNVLWDGLTGHEEALFGDPLEWMEKTIAFCKERRIGVYLKLHPASPPPHASDFLPPDLRAWCRILHEESSYSLAAAVDLNLVFNGTLAFELPILGLPVISVSRSHYQHKGPSYVPATLEEYWRLVGDPTAPGLRGLLVRAEYEEQSIRCYRFNRVYRWSSLRCYHAGEVPEEAYRRGADATVLEWILRRE